MPTHPHAWQFRPRFRRHAYGWKSQPAIKRIREAVSEIKKVVRQDPVLAAEGAVLFLEKLSPAVERVDSSSGSIGTAVGRAIDALVSVIAGAPADAETRDAWLERLWEAYQEDEIPYLEALGDWWGELCASAEVSGRWADRLIDRSRTALSPDVGWRGFFKGTSCCLSALLAAGRHHEILELLEGGRRMWHYRQYGVRALAAMGRTDEAIDYAENDITTVDSPAAIAAVLEEILRAAGRTEEAYWHTIEASRTGTYLAWFRAVARKYPDKAPAAILEHLVAQTPGDEGKWFAAAKDAGLLDEAIALARRSPCSPQTLTRAARDFADRNPSFALEAGVMALLWMVRGYGYELTGVDVRDAYRYTMQAAGNAGCAAKTQEVIRTMVSSGAAGAGFVSRVLGAELGQS